MQPNTLKEPAAKAPWAVIHPLSEQDSVGAAALRSAVAPMKGKFEGTYAATISPSSFESTTAALLPRPRAPERSW